VGITGDQQLSFIRYALAAEAGHGTIHQAADWGLYSKSVECYSTYDVAMNLDHVFIFGRGSLQECPGFIIAGLDHLISSKSIELVHEVVMNNAN
jgi:hypothetical protein